jgi:AraC-like DNA-binding protein/mannose-6-phosphate isomerase-like protein (cupin superfamily)
VNIFYETHQDPDSAFPFTFHLDTVTVKEAEQAHWHESLELLYFIEGDGFVLSDTEKSAVSPGDLAVVNSGNLHNVVSAGRQCRYYCLIIDKSFSDELEIPVDKLHFSPVISDKTAQSLMEGIIREILGNDHYYRQAVKAAAAELLVYLCRVYSLSGGSSDRNGTRKSKIVKKGIGVMRRRFQETLSLEEICGEIGYSKYYFCHLFREYTGKSVMDYLQRYRCGYARSLLRSGICNVQESARSCGIPNLSHFSKLYKRYIGISPKDENKVKINNQLFIN